jgi:hypothetical protein
MRAVHGHARTTLRWRLRTGNCVLLRLGVDHGKRLRLSGSVGLALLVLAAGFGGIVPVEPSAADFEVERGGAFRRVQGEAGW